MLLRIRSRCEQAAGGHAASVQKLLDLLLDHFLSATAKPALRRRRAR